MIVDMLKPENVRIVNGVDHWEEAIHLSLIPLVEGGFVTDEYEKAIIESTKVYGPYYVLAEDLALIHGRPTDGVIEKQIAITLLKNPVKFSEDSFPVRILIALAASDSSSHIDVMKVLSNIFMNEQKVEELTKADNPNRIYEMLVQLERELENV